jgi:hypothetical protein
LFDRSEPGPTTEGSGPSGSGAHALGDQSIIAISSDSDCHSDDGHELVGLTDENGNIDGIPKVDWVAQQRHAFMEQSGIPAKALEGETQASQQKKREAARRVTERKAKKATVKNVRVKKEGATSEQDFMELGPHFVRDRVGTRSSTSHRYPSHGWVVHEATAAPLSSAAPQDRKPPAKKGGYANPPGSQRSKLQPSPFPLPKGSPPLQDFELPKRIA